uniref:Uncharacterized protein n=1 Tax=Eutreptiella gymnastica TaxID=73025 RepID=A0A7S4C930_9EUGL
MREMKEPGDIGSAREIRFAGGICRREHAVFWNGASTLLMEMLNKASAQQHRQHTDKHTVSHTAPQSTPQCTPQYAPPERHTESIKEAHNTWQHCTTRELDNTVDTSTAKWE